MYKEKYLKYKTKYLDLKSQIGSGVDEEIEKTNRFINDTGNRLINNEIYLLMNVAPTEKNVIEYIKAQSIRLWSNLEQRLIARTVSIANKSKSKITREARIAAEIDLFWDMSEEELSDYIKYKNVNLISTPAERQEARAEKIRKKEEEKQEEEARAEKRRLRKEANELKRKEMKEKGYPPSVQDGLISEEEFNYGLEMQHKVNQEFTYELSTTDEPVWTGWHEDPEVMKDFRENRKKYFLEENGKINQ